MPGPYRDRIAIQEYTEIDDPLGSYKEWKDVEARWGREASLSTEGRAQYQQIGHSKVEKEFVFPGGVELTISDHRMKHRGNYYKAVEPPRVLGGIKKITRIAVEEVGPEDEPE